MPELLAVCRLGALIAAGVLLARLVAQRSRRVDVSARVANGALTVSMRRLDAVLAQRHRLAVALTDVEAVCVRLATPIEGLPIWGTSLPGGLRVGTFLVNGEREFWDVRGPGEVLLIELRAGAPWARLVLQLPDPQATALTLRPHVRTLVPTWF